MVYQKTIWKDRVAQRPRTYIESSNADGSITHVPAEGTITEAGTPVNASNLNKIENELYILSAQLEEITSDIDAGIFTDTAMGIPINGGSFV